MEARAIEQTSRQSVPVAAGELPGDVPSETSQSDTALATTATGSDRPGRKPAVASTANTSVDRVTATNLAVPSSPHMDRSGLEAFKEYLAEATSYLEYGCGGSTVLAAGTANRNIYSVESSSVWADAVRTAVSNLPSRCWIAHCDVGVVGSWGRPIDQSKIAGYHRYPVLPWERARQDGRVPSLVLIDGRFRVAPFLYSLMMARPGTPILFDDYAERPNYHVVERHCAVKEMRGRMAVFIATRQFSASELMADFARHSILVD